MVFREKIRITWYDFLFNKIINVTFLNNRKLNHLSFWDEYKEERNLLPN